MVTKIALILSIALQFVAAFLAIRLTKVTKYNLSWILISAGFILMTISRFIDFIPILDEKIPINWKGVNIWVGFITSVFITVGVFLIRKIFKFLDKVEQSRREAEKRVLNAVIQTEENERKRFAKDLHDGLGPLLSTVKLSISTLSQLEKDEVTKNIVDNTDVVINEAIKSIKEISNNLSPHILNNFGLASAINSFINKISYTRQINIAFDSNIFNQRFDGNIEVILYRVVCELINNTMKHAHAQNIEIILNRYDSRINLVYTDDGVGFDVNQVLFDENYSGMGYSNILSRIRSIKGTIDVESNDNSGTKVVIQVSV
ncbi:MAG: histidine kinase [Bacteroidota bacterium]|nr:histidine kinase [Bacteroidota bacterium]